MSKFILVFLMLLLLSVFTAAQSQGGMALGPARFELEMKPGTETTVVVNLDYHAPFDAPASARIVASLNDWSITSDGRVEYYRPNSQPNSASSWLIYSPGEAAVVPGTTHQIRVTISVPPDASPGDHLTALIIEQRPQTLSHDKDIRQIIVRYRMASVFYIKVPRLTRQGDFSDLYARSTSDGIVVTPTLRNQGNSVIRPTAAINVTDDSGQIVADVPAVEPLPILGGSETKQPVLISKALPPGHYTVKYRVDFQDGKNATEGVADLVVPANPQIASSSKPPLKP